MSSGDDHVIPVVEDALRVGKRELNHGRVRVRSYVVENPVGEQVSLRDETISIERRALDRPVTGSENAVVAPTIEAEEHHEEAAVSKDVHVVEEIALRKTAEQREETITDMVRRTVRGRGRTLRRRPSQELISYNLMYTRPADSPLAVPFYPAGTDGELRRYCGTHDPVRKRMPL